MIIVSTTTRILLLASITLIGYYGARYHFKHQDPALVRTGISNDRIRSAIEYLKVVKEKDVEN